MLIWHPFGRILIFCSKQKPKPSWYLQFLQQGKFFFKVHSFNLNIIMDTLSESLYHRCRVINKTLLNSILKLFSILTSGPKSSILPPDLFVLIQNAQTLAQILYVTKFSKPYTYFLSAWTLGTRLHVTMGWDHGRRYQITKFQKHINLIISRLIQWNI